VVETIKSIESKTTKARVILALSIFFALVFGWFAVSRQFGNMLAELTSPSAPNAAQVAAVAVDFAPRDPLARWLAANVESNKTGAANTINSLAATEEVVRLAPRDFRWWIELGRAREKAEQYDQAETALRYAAELAPAYVFPRWQLGNFYLRRNREDEAFAELKKAIADNVSYREQVYSIAWDYFDRDAAKIEEIAGKAPDAKMSLIKFYVGKDRADDALRIWNTLSDEEKQLDPVYAKLIGQLLYEKRFFRSAVTFAAQNGIDPEARAETMMNGGFENSIGEPKETYFNWKITPAAKLEIKTDQTQKKEGARSLRVLASGYAGVDLINHIWQLTAVAPNEKYRVQFAFKTENLKSAGTPTVEIVNANDDKIIVSSKPFPTGSNDWQEITLDFTTPENAEGIIIRMARAYCGEVCPMTGAFWLDDFKISKQ
jgi:tetratricopeptide (TPR) repeat protein